MPITAFTISADYGSRTGGGVFSSYVTAEDFFNMLIEQQCKPKYMSMMHHPDQGRHPPEEAYLVMEYTPDKGVVNHGIKKEYAKRITENERRIQGDNRIRNG